MKKVIALILSIVIIAGCFVTAFAEGESGTTPCPYCNKDIDNETYSYHVEACRDAKASAGNKLTCPYCGNMFSDEAQYNNHITICYDQKGNNDNETSYSKYDKFVDISISDLIADTLEAMDITAAQWDSIDLIVIRLLDMFETFVQTIILAFNMA